jgi:hypothetical protein
VHAIDGPNAADVIARAFAASRQVWFVGSRFQGREAEAIVGRLAAGGEVVLRQARARALVMAVRRREQ